MLGCTADDGKLPPYVVFQRKTMMTTIYYNDEDDNMPLSALRYIYNIKYYVICHSQH
jgi:hypothetical protein